MILLKKISLLILLTLIFSCGSDKDLPINSEKEINIEEAKLTDFPFKEIAHVSIDITQPVIDNNVELTEGEIIITLPHTVTSTLLTLNTVNIDTNKFNIFPSVGTQKLFSETSFVKYTITAKNDFDKKLNYNVKIIIEPAPEEEKLSILNFELLSNDNSAFTDIDFVKDAVSLQTVDSLLVCLFPKTIDFSDLTPAIRYVGSKIEYRINDESFKEYSVNDGEKIDFKYPNTVDFKISNSTNSKSVTYRIIVDTEYPISFNTEEITIPDLKIGNTYNGVEVATWKNIGNYPISTMSPNEFINTITPATGINNIFRVFLSKNSGGYINPNENGIINIIVTNTPLIGEYQTNALFKLNFNQNTRVIVNTPRDNYINDFGYKNSNTLKIKGVVIN